MALELRQSLSLTQQLIMTPQLQQAIKLLQLSRLELLESINEEMEANPILEEQAPSDSEDDGFDYDRPNEPENKQPEIKEVTVEERARDDVDWENYISEYSTVRAETPYEEREGPPLENMSTTKTSFHSHLMWQLNMSDFDDEQKEIGFYIIGNVDEDGYLDLGVEEIARDTGHPVEKVSETLNLIKHFDPVGVASADMRECLLTQARFQNLSGTIVEKIIENHLSDLEYRKYDRIAKKLSVPLNEVYSAVNIILGMEPRPGSIYSSEETIYITPDIYVFKVGDDYEIVQNEDGMPKLRINSYYKEVLSNKAALSDNVKDYIHEKLRSAAWLIKSIHQRQRTIFKVTESIIKFQRDFLDNGITSLKPLVLRDVAEDIEMHESTVSRVTTNKYVHTPQGLFELKFFFNSSISSIEGDAVASESVKAHIKNIIKAENKAKPYSDQDVADLLKNLNIKVARRTVAKYRETMGILPSRRRKTPY